MYPSLDSHNNHPPQSVQLLLHCNCGMYQPFYHSVYRPPFMPPYIPQPLPRPYHLQHYQYTQFVSPFNVPTSNPATVMPSQSVQQSTSNQTLASTIDLPFGPPPRDRRILERQENPEDDVEDRKTAPSTRFESMPISLTPSTQRLATGIDMGNLGDLKSSLDMFDCPRTENFINMLELGCTLAENIAVRNQHRPCFKNIQNLCSRTRGEILKPNTTHANIHSQGIPWATKDFIYAFVRAVNCWYILNGYMGESDPKLGKVEKEISPEFRECYRQWEEQTKNLTRHLIKVFVSLDSIVSNLSNFSQNSGSSAATTLNKTVGSQVVQRKTNGNETEESSSNFYSTKRTSSSTNLSFVKGIRGVLQVPGSSSETPLQASGSNTEVSLKNDDSEDEVRTYMKPGSYKTPKKKMFNESIANSPRSIEFFERAQNVPAHYRRITAGMSDSQNSEGDKAWRSAKDTASNFVKRKETVNVMTSESASVEGQLEHFFDIASQREVTEIESWISNSPFSCDSQGEETREKDFDNGKGACSKQVTVLQRPKEMGNEAKMDENVKQFTGDVMAASLKRVLIKGSSGSNDVTSRVYRKREQMDSKGYSGASSLTPKVPLNFRKPFCGNYWEHRNGGLTDSAIEALQNIVNAMEMTELSLTMKESPQAILGGKSNVKLTDLDTIKQNLKAKRYTYVNEVVRDFRSFINCIEAYFIQKSETRKVTVFRNKFEKLIANEFPNVDFSSIGGDFNENVGPLIFKKGRSKKFYEGNGDN